MSTTDPTAVAPARTAPVAAPAAWVGAALVAAPVIYLLAEAVVASAWDRRPYSYLDDYVNFLGSPFAGEFEGITISSPLWWVMSAAWILTGLLIAAASIGLGRSLSGWRRRAMPAVGVAQGISLVLFAVFPLGPEAMADGTIVLYLVGAFGSIIAGNALAVVTGLSGRSLRFSRRSAGLSVGLGIAGLVNIPLTYGWTPIGLAERISVYSYLISALITGIVLLRARRSP